MKFLQQKGAQLILKRQELKQVYSAKPDGDYSDDEIAKIKSLTGEITALDEEISNLQAIEAEISRNEKGLKDFATPSVATMPGEGPRKTAYRAGRVKSFTGVNAVKTAHDLGMWFLGSVVGNAKAAKYCRENGIEIKNLVESDNSRGGYLVPEQFVAEMIDLREQFGIFRQYAHIVIMTSDTATRPRRKGGLQTYYIGEGQKIPTSDTGWEDVGLKARKLAVIAKWSSELNEDAVIGIGDELAHEISSAFSLAEDNAGFNGDGTSAFGNIIGIIPKLRGLDADAGKIAGLVAGTGSGFNGLVVKDFRRMVGRLPVYADTPDARWFCHKTFYQDVMLASAEATNGTSSNEIVDGQRTPIFMGYPVQYVQVMQKDSAGNIIPLMLGNIRAAAMMGDRRQVTLATSEHVDFETDQLTLRGTQRYDISVHDVGNADATASKRQPGPVVGLITGA